MVTLQRTDGHLFRIRLADSYWARLLIDNFEYEPEVGSFLRRLPRPFRFIDCGANIGYWSVIVSSLIGSDNVVAVEPSPHLYPLLAEQAHLNGSFRCLNAAVWDHCARVSFAGNVANHASGRVVSDGVHTVEALTLDDITASLEPPFVVKLDIEGAERTALDGAESTLGTRPLVIFEELGNDRIHDTACFFLNQPDAHIGFLAPHGGVTPVEDIATLEQVKRRAERERRVPPELAGHNFVAFYDRLQFERTTRHKAYVAHPAPASTPGDSTRSRADHDTRGSG